MAISNPLGGTPPPGPLPGLLPDALSTVEFGPSVRTRAIEVATCRLVVVEGPSRGRAIVAPRAIARIGAHEENDLILGGDNTVSRFHCEIRQVQGEYLLVDRDSTNGCWIGKLRIREAFLYPNCEIRIGNSLVRFEPVTEALAVEPLEQDRYGELVGATAVMRAVYGFIDKVAPSELSVVVYGETGTGKELVARALHARSRRSAKPLVVFDCSAIPPNLIESELFGHEKGAFSGAIRQHRGVFEQAKGGTLFFDELGELPLSLQPKFLRALETGEVRRVGGERSIRIDTRVVAATNRDLPSLIQAGTFRRDLYYRLAKASMTLPSLRDRRDDIPLLAAHFLVQRPNPDAASPQRFGPDALAIMRAYSWPGNARELRNVVDRAAAFCDTEFIGASHLPAELSATTSDRAGRFDGISGLPSGLKEAKEAMVSRFEKAYLADLLMRHNHNISQVARDAGIDRRHVYRLLKKYELE